MLVCCAVASALRAPARSGVRGARARAAASSDVMDAVGVAWGLAPATHAFDISLQHEAPPLLRVRHFLTDAECDAIVAAASGDDVEVCTEYLNHRVNAGEEAGDSSGYDEAAASAALEWSDGATSGLRVRAPASVVETVAPRVLDLLGLEGRGFRVADQLYYRPDRATVLVRDATVVRYRGGEGVAPHVDGKDATVLVYLNTVEGGGGRTVFPEDGLAFSPVKGDALVYDSRDDLLHFAEPVLNGREKWILQLLVDHRLPPGGDTAPLVDWETGKILPG